MTEGQDTEASSSASTEGVGDTKERFEWALLRRERGGLRELLCDSTRGTYSRLSNAEQGNKRATAQEALVMMMRQMGKGQMAKPCNEVR